MEESQCLASEMDLPRRDGKVFENNILSRKFYLQNKEKKGERRMQNVM